jgi:pimeloyl-ACP methyl ester carboxylesterase
VGAGACCARIRTKARTVTSLFNATKLFTIGSILSLLVGCRGAPAVQLGPSGWLPDGGYYEKTVHYGTTRPDMLGAGVSGTSLAAHMTRLDSGNARSEPSVAYGRVKVMIPFDKTVGGTEGMSVSALDHGIGWEEFGGGLKTDDLVVFIHGYATSFTDAAIRAAQMAHDTHFQGEAVLFSWPSGGHVTEYFADQARATESVVPLAEFLAMLANNTTKRIHVVAHSLGTYILTKSLAWLDQHPTVASIDLSAVKARRQGRLFGQIILAAPDVDTENYLATFADVDVSALAERVTLYSSHNDMVLKMSRFANPTAAGPSLARLGDSAAAFVVAKGMDTVDARREISPQFFGHSFYAEYPALVSDIHEVLTQGLAPDDRMLQKVTDARGQSLWFVRTTTGAYVVPGRNSDDSDVLVPAAAMIAIGVLMSIVMAVKPWTVRPSPPVDLNRPVLTKEAAQAGEEEVEAIRWLLVCATCLASVPFFVLGSYLDNSLIMIGLTMVATFIISWVMVLMAPSHRRFVTISLTVFAALLVVPSVFDSAGILDALSNLAPLFGTALTTVSWWGTMKARERRQAAR